MSHSFSQDILTRAFEYDVVENDIQQALLTKKLLLPKLKQIIYGVNAIREAFDKKFLAETKNHKAPTPYGFLSPDEYPVGYCGIIRDNLFEVLKISPFFTSFCRQGVLLKKIYVILDGRYFQNAIQLGNLYLDVGNDTVDIHKPKVVCKPLKEVDYKCFEDYDECFDIAENYLNIKLYPNLIFPLITPIFPVFAISENGEISLFNTHMVIAFKSMIRHYEPIRKFLLSSPYIQRRRLPSEYIQLIKDQYKQNNMNHFCVKFEERAAVGTVVDFITKQLQNKRIDKVHADEVLFSIAMQALQQFDKLSIKPDEEMLMALWEKGVVPKPVG